MQVNKVLSHQRQEKRVNSEDLANGDNQFAVSSVKVVVFQVSIQLSVKKKLKELNVKITHLPGGYLRETLYYIKEKL